VANTDWWLPLVDSWPPQEDEAREEEKHDEEEEEEEEEVDSELDREALSPLIGVDEVEELAELERDEEQVELIEERPFRLAPRCCGWAPEAPLVAVEWLKLCCCCCCCWPVVLEGFSWMRQEERLDSFCLLLGDRLASSKPSLLAAPADWLRCCCCPCCCWPFWPKENNLDRHSVVPGWRPLFAFGSSLMVCLMPAICLDFKSVDI